MQPLCVIGTKVTSVWSAPGPTGPSPWDRASAPRRVWRRGACGPGPFGSHQDGRAGAVASVRRGPGRGGPPPGHRPVAADL